MSPDPARAGAARPRVRRLLPALAALLAAGAAAVAGAAVWDGRRLAEQAGRFEVEAREERAARLLLAGETSALAGEHAEQRETIAGLRREVRRLEQALEQALDHSRAIGAALTEESEAREQAAVERAGAVALATVPPPTGVRRCLEALHRCCEADGFTGLRFLRASAVDGTALRDVELLDASRDPLVADLIVAERMTAVLDRTAGRLELRFSGGHRRVAGVRSALPEEGFAVTLAPVTGPMWEARLPYLVRTVGDYPAAAPEAEEAPVLDVYTRALWLERLETLLRGAGTDVQLRVAGFGDLCDGWFREVRLSGYDSGRLLALSADCKSMAVEVDEGAGVVSLLLRDGTLRREGAESTIGPAGYRILLPDLRPERTIETMMGMVVRK